MEQVSNPVSGGVEMSVNPGSTTLPDGRVVELGYRIYKIYKINTEDSAFTVDFRLFARWKDEDVKEIVEDTWRPYIELSNCIEQEIVDENFILESEGETGQKKGYLRLNRRYRAKLFQQYDLANFPFDDHLLRIVLRIPKAIHKCIMQADKTRVEGKQVDGTTMNPFQMHEWQHYEPRYKIVSEGEHTWKRQFHIELPVRRHYKYYLFSIYGIMCMLTSLAFLILISPANNITDRLDLTFSLLVSMIAFKFVLADKVPNVNYMTRLDVYIYVCFGFLFSIAFESALMAWIGEKTAGGDGTTVDLAVINKLFGIGLVAAWGLFNIFQMAHKYVLISDQKERLGKRPTVALGSRKASIIRQQSLIVSESGKRDAGWSSARAEGASSTAAVTTSAGREQDI
jgi:hypothetical protein